jgi:hypothetical protein
MIKNDVKIEAFGKIIFIPTRPEVPRLPDMKLLVRKEEDSIVPYRALCIDLEMDAAGRTIDDACNNLKESIQLYLRSEIEAWGSLPAAARHIIDTAYEETAGKAGDFREYRRIKYQYIQTQLRENKPVDPILEEMEMLKGFDKMRKEHKDSPFLTEFTEQRVA